MGICLLDHVFGPWYVRHANVEMQLVYSVNRQTCPFYTLVWEHISDQALVWSFGIRVFGPQICCFRSRFPHNYLYYNWSKDCTQLVIQGL